MLYNCYIVFLSQSKISLNSQDTNAGKLMLQIIGYKKRATCFFFKGVMKRFQSYIQLHSEKCESKLDLQLQHSCVIQTSELPRH